MVANGSNGVHVESREPSPAPPPPVDQEEEEEGEDGKSSRVSVLLISGFNRLFV